METEVMTVTFAGKTQTIKEWSRETGISSGALRQRLKNGWPIEKVLTEPQHRHSGERSIVTMLKNKQPEGCCVPHCDRCPLPDCSYNGKPTIEETRITKNALKKLPEEGIFDHVYMTAKQARGIR